MATTKQLKQKRALRDRRRVRIRARVEGTAARPRLSVFRSLTNIYAQVIDDLNGQTLVSASTIDKEIAPQISGKSKTEAAKIVGQALAQRAKDAGIAAVVFDRGGYKYHGRVAALAEGAREGGLSF
ncbi:MAG: 50S ribosomal protein L18 [Anaerolineae bacterium]|nr:50S ribosomal protein L18 [Anaerolineae bacterium]NUQ03604.1 50S ribosomal protein L18 [Anaerolineae bacterium]